MPTTLECAVKNQSTSFAETIILAQDRDWAGAIDYHAAVRTAALIGTLGVVFRWKDRAGVSRNHTVVGLSLLTLGPIVSNSFQLWTQFANPSNITLELTLAGITGAPTFDFFCNGYGNSYGA